MHIDIQLDAGTEIEIKKNEDGNFELFISSDRTSHLSLKLGMTPEMMNLLAYEMDKDF